MSRRSYLLSELPSGYDELECINTTGAAACAVPYNSVPDTRGFIIKFKYADTISASEVFIFCGVYRARYAGWSFRISSDNKVYYMYMASNAVSATYKDAYYTSGTDATVSYVNGTLTYCDGTTETAPAIKTSTNDNSYFGIGGYWSNSSLKSYNRNVVISFKRVQLLNGTTPVIDLRPARRQSDSKIGMYDVINDVFYSSTTGTEFTTD